MQNYTNLRNFVLDSHDNHMINAFTFFYISDTGFQNFRAHKRIYE